MPLKRAGILIEPPKSEPIPITEAPAPSNAPLNENIFKYIFSLFYFPLDIRLFH